MIAAQRDRWNHTGPAALRLHPGSQAERIDAARARKALARLANSAPSQIGPLQRSADIGLAL
jgi:hypothetical protein